MWQQKYKIEPHELPSYLDTPDDLWGLGDSLLPFDRDNPAKNSLYLVQVGGLDLYCNKIKTRAKFTYRGREYDLAVTDPRYFGEQPENKETPQGILCISLGEEYTETKRRYKLVTAIF